MIDLHSHVLPGIDDGSKSMEMSLEMLALAAESGVETLVTTPHCNIPDEFENYADEFLEDLWDRLEWEREQAEIPIQLCKGMEVFATPELPELLKQGKIWTLNGTRNFLIEFSFDEDPAFCSEILQACVDLDYYPIIAHPERYFFVQEDPGIAFEWCTAEYGLQVNKGSLLGHFGPGPMFTAELLIEHGLVACVASDAHRPHRRSTHMGEIYRYLTQEYGNGFAHLLLEENPARILNGEELLGFEPIPFD